MQYIMQTEAEQQEFNGSQNSGQISSWKHCKALKSKKKNRVHYQSSEMIASFKLESFKMEACWACAMLTELHTCDLHYRKARYTYAKWAMPHFDTVNVGLDKFVLRDHFCLREWNWFLLKAETHLNLCNLLKSFWRVSWPRVPIHLFINLYVIPILLKACM